MASDENQGAEDGISRRSPTGEPILMGVVAAENATRLSELDDDEFLSAALTALEPFLAVPDAAGSDE